jgi:hypothetical protein
MNSEILVVGNVTLRHEHSSHKDPMTIENTKSGMDETSDLNLLNAIPNKRNKNILTEP